MYLKSLRTLLISLCLILVTTTAGFTQDYIDLMRIEYSISKGNDFESSPGTSDVEEWVIDATIPLALSKRSTILTGFLFENLTVTPYAGQDKLSVYTRYLLSARKMGSEYFNPDFSGH